jgi:hypothetical protein
MQELFAALPTLLKSQCDIDEVRESVVFAMWRRVAGEAVRAHAMPVALEGERLKVAVADRMWLRHLDLLAKEMIFRLNGALGRKEVAFIEFYIDARAVGDHGSDEDTRRRLVAEAEKQITDDLAEAARSISNDDLRKAFLLAAGSCLARAERAREQERSWT